MEVLTMKYLRRSISTVIVTGTVTIPGQDPFDRPSGRPSPAATKEKRDRS